jgi:hypothetical protein
MSSRRIDITATRKVGSTPATTTIFPPTPRPVRVHPTLDDTHKDDDRWLQTLRRERLFFVLNQRSPRPSHAQELASRCGRLTPTPFAQTTNNVMRTSPQHDHRIPTSHHVRYRQHPRRRRSRLTLLDGAQVLFLPASRASPTTTMLNRPPSLSHSVESEALRSAMDDDDKSTKHWRRGRRTKPT